MSQAQLQNTQKLSKEDFRKQKVLDEARKAGTVAAEVDPETGRDINPHIPQYIAQAPWYLDVGHPTLKHQRPETELDKKDEINLWYTRGLKTGPAATSYRKGACENCGSKSHKKKDCLDRPRKTLAKFSNKDIQQDDMLQNIKLETFDAKRDRWNGYDTSEQTELIREWELVEDEKRRIREKEAEAKLGMEKEDSSGGSDDEEDGEKYGDNADAIEQKLDTKSRTTVRNLRMREDTAKYLLNLDVNSAYYDPKTRSMRDNPNKEKDSKDLIYSGDNFVRYTGEASKMANAQLFAWSAAKHNKDVHLQANPTQAELLNKEFASKKDTLSSVQKDSILDKYGGEEYLNAPPMELLLSQTENYVEYSQTGKVIKGQEKAKIRSVYEEDVFLFNHTKVWGSYWKDGKWGFACCHEFIKGAWCKGEAGKKAAIINEEMMAQKLTALAPAVNPQKKVKPNPILEKAELGTGKVDVNKLQSARKAERARLEDVEDDRDKKKVKYNSMGVQEVTEEELEAYRMERARAEDPMANYKDE